MFNCKHDPICVMISIMFYLFYLKVLQKSDLEVVDF